MMGRLFHIFLLLAGLYACSVALPVEPTMNNLLQSNVRPWCIGRFVFDRPVSSDISNERYVFRGNKLETIHNVSLETYRIKVETREKELRKERRIDPGNRNAETTHAWLEKAFSPVQNSRVFVFNDAVAKAVVLPFDTEFYVHADHTIFHATGGIGASALDRAEDIYSDTVRRIKPRDNWTIPTESGFCFNGGIVTGSSTLTEEVSQSFALVLGRPALLLIKMRDSVTQDQAKPLTDNLADLRAQLNRMPGNYRILRQGKRPIAGIDADEVLFALQDGPVTIFRFYLLAPGNPDTLAQPHTAIQLLLGAPPQADLPPDQATSPVDEAGALQLWDTLLNSLRLRPGAV